MVNGLLNLDGGDGDANGVDGDDRAEQELADQRRHENCTDPVGVWMRASAMR